MNSEEKRLLDCKAAAKYIGLTEAALRKRIFLRQVGGLVKLGGRLYFDRKKLAKFVDELEEVKNDRK